MINKSSMDPAALVLTSSDPNTRKRIARNINVLKNLGYRVIIASPFRPSDESIIYLPLSVNDISQIYGKRLDLRILKKIIMFIFTFPFSLLVSLGGIRWITTLSKLRYQFKVIKKNSLGNFNLKVILVEEIDLAPIALLVNKNYDARIILDLRDFYWNNTLATSCSGRSIIAVIGIIVKWLYSKVLRATYRLYIPKADVILCVSYGHAKQLKYLFDVDAIVILSAPDYIMGLFPTAVAANEIKFVYHGIATRERSIDLLINAVNKSNPSISLHLYLTDPQPGYVEKLKSLAGRKIIFHEPVAYENLIVETNKYDVGLVFFPPLHSSLQDALPNKFFEYIQARLAIISGPSPDMMDIINKHNIGKVTDGFTTDDLVKTINNLSPSLIQKMKSNSHNAAPIFNFSVEEKKLIEIFHPSSMSY